jgi:hypothetical protein
MSYKIKSPEYAHLDALRAFELPMSTIALVDNVEKTYETMPLYQFLEANEDGFTPYETLDLISTLLLTGRADFAGGVGQTYTLVLVDLCVNNPDEFEFADVEHDTDLLAGLRDHNPSIAVEA